MLSSRTELNLQITVGEKQIEPTFPSEEELVIEKIKAGLSKPLEFFRVENIALFPNSDIIFVKLLIQSLFPVPIKISSYQLESSTLPTQPLLQKEFTVLPNEQIGLIFQTHANDRIFSPVTRLIPQNQEQKELVLKKGPNYTLYFQWVVLHPDFETDRHLFRSQENVLLPKNRVHVGLSECPLERRVGDFFTLTYFVRLDTATTKSIIISFNVDPLAKQWLLHGRRVFSFTLQQKLQTVEIPVQLLAVRSGLISVPIPEVKGFGVEIAVSSHSIHKQIRVFPPNELITTWTKDVDI